MPDNVNSELKPCLKGHKSIFSGRRGNDKNWLITCLTCERKRIETQFFMVYASTEEKAILIWNNRPGEDAAHLKQFEEDCKVVELMIDDETHPDDMMPGAYHYNQGIATVLKRLRQAWEERHNRKEEHEN